MLHFPWLSPPSLGLPGYIIPCFQWAEDPASSTDTRAHSRRGMDMTPNGPPTWSARRGRIAASPGEERMVVGKPAGPDRSFTLPSIHTYYVCISRIATPTSELRENTTDGMMAALIVCICNVCTPLAAVGLACQFQACIATEYLWASKLASGGTAGHVACGVQIGTVLGGGLGCCKPLPLTAQPTLDGTFHIWLTMASSYPLHYVLHCLLTQRA